MNFSIMDICADNSTENALFIQNTVLNTNNVQPFSGPILTPQISEVNNQIVLTSPTSFEGATPQLQTQLEKLNINPFGQFGGQLYFPLPFPSTTSSMGTVKVVNGTVAFGYSRVAVSDIFGELTPMTYGIVAVENGDLYEINDNNYTKIDAVSWSSEDFFSIKLNAIAQSFTAYKNREAIATRKLLANGIFYFNIGVVTGQNLNFSNNFKVGSTNPSGTDISYTCTGEQNVPDGTTTGQYSIWIENADTQSGSWQLEGNENIRLGKNSGGTYQGVAAVALGFDSGISQGENSIALGNQAGHGKQSTNSIAIGTQAGMDAQKFNSIAIGNSAAASSQQEESVAIGTSAGNNNQGMCAVSVGASSGSLNQGPRAIAMGYNAGNSAQNSDAIAIGCNAGKNNQGSSAIAIGSFTTSMDNQPGNSIVIGSGFDINTSATEINPQTLLLGNDITNKITQGEQIWQNTNDATNIIGSSIAIIGGALTTTGFLAPVGVPLTVVGAGMVAAAGTSGAALGTVQLLQGENISAVGNASKAWNDFCAFFGSSSAAGNSNPNAIPEPEIPSTNSLDTKLNMLRGPEQNVWGSLTIGNYSGIEDPANLESQSSQGNSAIIIGNFSGSKNQGAYATSIGYKSATENQGIGSIGIGYKSACINQNENSVAIGTFAGMNMQGSYSIAVGFEAGYDNQSANSIILNASGSKLDAPNSGFFVEPIRAGTGMNNILFYNESTKEIVYSSEPLIVGPTGPQGSEGPTGPAGDVTQAVEEANAATEEATAAAEQALAAAGEATAAAEYATGSGDTALASSAEALAAAAIALESQGPAGPEGPAGPKGDTGDKGEKGDKGDTGDTGEKGSPGAPGAQGEMGPQGPTGAAGQVGSIGPEGLQGPTGSQGLQGSTGSQGLQGPTGSDFWVKDADSNIFYPNITSYITPNGPTGTINNSVIIDNNLVVLGKCYANKFYATSDYRIKINQEEIDLDKYNIDNLKPKVYDNTLTDEKDIGFIAHELQEIYPFLVKGKKDDEEYQSVNYIPLISLLVKEVQEQKKIINKLNDRIEQLEKRY